MKRTNDNAQVFDKAVYMYMIENPQTPMIDAEETVKNMNESEMQQWAKDFDEYYDYQIQEFERLGNELKAGEWDFD